ncbi:MAG: TetR family transcriptional regulator [Gemmatimonadetes bacterium]|nr:TetR family transcriptional regulator [Gemmatimonadota bacterium]
MVDSTSIEPRWRRMPEERPRQILDAAFEVFAEQGLAAARLDDIAKRAGVSKGTIYLYFPNKEELFREMVRNTILAQIEIGEQAPETASATDDLVECMRGYWSFLRSSTFPVLYRLIQAELRNFPELAQFYAEEVIARGHRLFCHHIQRGIEKAEFRALDPSVATRMLLGSMVMHSLWCSKRSFFPSVAERSDEQVFDEITDFILHALRPAPVA